MVSMGTKRGPSYACIFMGYFEYLFGLQYQGTFTQIYTRFTDDGIGITNMPVEEFRSFGDDSNRLGLNKVGDATAVGCSMVHSTLHSAGCFEISECPRFGY